ncbi:hypothetical protein PV326_011386 [Microctonus aethiopoides]|nr:hypothetical protein PV326_011386 [Microctonus aethiopoides]
MYPYFLFPATARTLNYDLNDHDHHRHGHYGMPELPGSYDAGKQRRHRHDKHPDAPAPALPPPPPPPSLPDTIVNEFDPAQSPPMLQPGTNVFAPRPNYEHGAVVVDRIDDDFGLPVDRLYDLREAFEGFVAQVKIISRPDNSTSFEVIESQLENPLIDADHQDLHALKQLALPGFRHRPHHRRNYSIDDSDVENGMRSSRFIIVRNVQVQADSNDAFYTAYSSTNRYDFRFYSKRNYIRRSKVN